MASTIIEFPFNSGAYEAADREWLPTNFLAVVENMRLDLDGRLGVRPGFTALGTSTFTPSVMFAYDVANYAGRLVALGDQTGQSRPTDLFELVNSTGVWRSTSGTDDGFASGPRLPRATAVREVGRIPDLDADAIYVRVATDGAVVCEVAQLNNGKCRFHVFNPATDQTLVLVVRPLSKATVIYDGSHFWLIGQLTATNAIVGYKFTQGTDKDLTGAFVTLVATPGNPLVDLAAAQTGVSDFTIAYIVVGTLSTLKANRFNNAGTSQSAFNVTAGATSLQGCACSGNAGGTLLSFAYQDTGAYFLITTSATGTGAVGPTSLFGGAVSGNVRIGMTQTGTTISLAGMNSPGTTTTVVTQLCTNQAANTLATTITYGDAFLTSTPAPINTGGHLNFYFGCNDALASIIFRGTNQLVEQAQSYPEVFKDQQLAGTLDTAANSICSSGLIGTKLYWGNLVRGIAPRNQDTPDTGGTTPAVTEMEMNDIGRRQIAQVGRQLHIAGGLPLVYDGRALVEQGFPELPVVSSLTQTTGGALALSGVYSVRVAWEVVDSRGQILRSTPSIAKVLTLVSTGNALTVVASTPHSLRRHPFQITSAGMSVRVGFYRTINGGANFFLDQYVTVTNTGNFGDPVTATLIQSDTAISDNAVLYVQSQTPVGNVSPGPCQFTWPARERQVVGGLPFDETWTFSKLLFPSEPVEFASPGQLGFSGRANQAITGVASFETSGIVFTKSEIGIVSGRGPEQNGTGDFDPFTLVPSPGGLIDWRSLVATPDGLFFQMLREKLMILHRGAYGDPAKGADAVEWIGQSIQQTLALFPVISAACYVRSQSQIIVAFSIQNVAGNDGRILVYDTKNKTWYVDTIGPVASLAELDGRLVYVLAGVVSLQDLAPGSGTFPTCAVQSGFLPVTKRLGWGRIYKIGLLFAALGPCSVEALIDYDDGAGLRSLGVEVLTGAEGQTERFWSLAVQKVSRFSVRFVVTGTSNTLGLRLNAWAAEVEGSPNMVRIGAGGQVA